MEWFPGYIIRWKKEKYKRIVYTMPLFMSENSGWRVPELGNWLAKEDSGNEVQRMKLGGYGVEDGRLTLFWEYLLWYL